MKPLVPLLSTMEWNKIKDQFTQETIGIAVVSPY
jgi:hypothetical protein